MAALFDVTDEQLLFSCRCSIYFIAAHRCKPIDIEYMKKLSKVMSMPYEGIYFSGCARSDINFLWHGALVTGFVRMKPTVANCC